MKKSIVMLVLAGAVMVSACSSYTCPTYSKAPQPRASQGIRI